MRCRNHRWAFKTDTTAQRSFRVTGTAGCSFFEVEATFYSRGWETMS
jgi:hypothetical protein